MALTPDAPPKDDDKPKAAPKPPPPPPQQAEEPVPEPLYALVNLCPTRVHMAASRLPPKQKFAVPPFAVILVSAEQAERLLTAARNPIGGTDKMHPWSRLLVDALGLKVEGQGPRVRGMLPVDAKKFERHFQRQKKVAWNPVWLPQGVPTLTRKQALAWMGNYGIDAERHMDSYLRSLENSVEDGADAKDAPNGGKPHVTDLEGVRVWVSKRREAMAKERSRGIGIKDPRPPFGPGSKPMRNTARV